MPVPSQRSISPNTAIQKWLVGSGNASAAEAKLIQEPFSRGSLQEAKPQLSVNQLPWATSLSNGSVPQAEGPDAASEDRYVRQKKRGHCQSEKRGHQSNHQGGPEQKSSHLNSGRACPLSAISPPRDKWKLRDSTALHKKRRTSNDLPVCSSRGPGDQGQRVEIRNVPLGALKFPTDEDYRLQDPSVSAPGRSDLNTLSSLGPVAESRYERAPRKKTRANRYELKRGSGKENPSRSNVQKTVRKGKHAEKTGSRLLHGFVAPNVLSDRLTVRMSNICARPRVEAKQA